MKKAGLFLGSFNPIHNGHLALAEYIKKHCNLDEIWFVVSPNNPLKDSRILLDEQLRLNMTREVLKEYDSFKVTDIEFLLPKPSYTINTLHALSEKYKDYSFTLIIGSDNMNIFDKWYKWEEIYNNYPVVVYPRGEDDLCRLSEKYPEMKVLNNAPHYDISSTMIRKLYKEGGNFSLFVPKYVNKVLITQNNLWE